MNLYLHADYLNIILWLVHASYITHWYCNSHTGAVMSMGAGATLSLSIKYNLNTSSSIETELVGIYDTVGLMMWTKYFMEAQGYIIDINILLQDNQSTIMIAHNVRSLLARREIT